MINNPTHISDAYSSCIDLMFTSQPNLVVESILEFTIHHPTVAKFSITRKRILNLSEEQ